MDGNTRWFVLAMALLPLALIFDFADGRVARWRRRSSMLGADLDSLADTDQLLIYDASAKVTKSCTALDVKNYIGSGALVAGGGTLAMTEAAHAGKTIALDTATGSVVTLPASTGNGARYRFLVTVTATSNSHVIKVANATDEMRGYVIQDSDTATAPNGISCTALS